MKRGGGATFAASVTSAFVIAFQVAGKSVRDATFLTNFEPRHLPAAMAAGAVLSLVAAFVIAKVLTKFSPSRAMPFAFAVSAAGLLLTWMLAGVSRHASALAVYWLVTVMSPVLLSGFWSVVDEHFDPHAAKGAVAKIAAGGTWGGVLGGAAAWRAAKVVSETNALVFLAVMNLLCAAGTIAIRNPKRATLPPAEKQQGAVSALRESPLLRNLTLLVLLGAIVSSLLDYVFSVQAAYAFKGQMLLSFLAFFGMCVSLTSLLVQTALGKAAIEKYGAAINIAVLPGIILVGSSFGLAVPGLLSSSLLRGAEMVQRNSLFRTAYEVLYTPVSEASKRATKTIIDVGVDRIGTIVGSGIVSVVLYLSATSYRQQKHVLAVCLVFALLTFVVIRGLHAGYVGTLEGKLREAADRASQPSALPRQSQPPQYETVVEAIENVRHPDDRHGPGRAQLRNPSALAHQAEALLSGDEERQRAALASWDENQRWLAGLGILLLAHPRLNNAAHSALGAIAPRITGELTDALCDSSIDFAIRRRVPSILAAARTQAAANGLIAGLSSDRFRIRAACGRALCRLTDQAPDIAIDQDAVVRAIAREADLTDPADVERLEEDDDDGTPVFERMVEVERLGRRIEHVFTLLAVVFEREPIRLCFHALQSDDQRRRGIALEYLESTLPSELRQKVMAMVNPDNPIPNPRAAVEVLRDLLREDEVNVRHSAPSEPHPAGA